jgi:hypothetical protein
VAAEAAPAPPPTPAPSAAPRPAPAAAPAPVAAEPEGAEHEAARAAAEHAGGKKTQTQRKTALKEPDEKPAAPAPEPPPAAPPAPHPAPAFAGSWEGPWTDPGKKQQGVFRLQVADDGAVSGTMWNGVARRSFRLSGKLTPSGQLDLACDCPAEQAFSVRGTVRPAGGGEFQGQLALATSAGVFGEPQVTLHRGGAGGAGPASGGASGPPERRLATRQARWAETLPGAWFQPEPSPVLYRFRSDGGGSRTTYPQGTQAPGQTFPFNWSLEGDTLTLKFPSGWFDLVTIEGYQPARSLLRRSSSRGWGNGPWFGCGSGRMPPEIERDTCR